MSHHVLCTCLHVSRKDRQLTEAEKVALLSLEGENRHIKKPRNVRIGRSDRQGRELPGSPGQGPSGLKEAA